MTVERLTTQPRAFGLSISKRQAMRLLIDCHDRFLAESRDVLRAGLQTASWITVDDTGARHAASTRLSRPPARGRHIALAAALQADRQQRQEAVMAEAVAPAIPTSPRTGRAAAPIRHPAGARNGTVLTVRRHGRGCHVGHSESRRATISEWAFIARM